MTLEDLVQTYTHRPVDTQQAEQIFRHMGRFGRTTVYSFSFETENARISAELCVKDGKITGFMPEKEPLEADEWSFLPAEPYQDAFTAEECARLDRYLASVLAPPAD